MSGKNVMMKWHQERFAHCPTAGALVVAFRTTYVVRRDHIEPWKFVCGRCGIEFVVPENELVFQSKDWLLAKV
jgi:hypothetical protein